MSDVVLKVDKLWKQYRLGVMGAGTLRDDLDRFIAKLRGKEDPTLKIGANNTLSEIEGDYVWALQNINFEVKRGEVLGIIGKNGAGKSTLLKILSKVTAPTKGDVKIKGRVASLLEVGTGFHPELTGRENIFLNGAILGMSKAEIRKKLDEIIDFAGVAKYVDTPTKRYSSGMRVRLGFAVAAFLEPEILVVDEVLAVGDVEFQKKAIGKMKDVSQGEGRTVLFVSHNMVSINALCQRGIVLVNGGVGFEGTSSEAVEFYLNENIEKIFQESNPVEFDLDEKLPLQILRVELVDEHNANTTDFRYGNTYKCLITLKLNIPNSKYFVALNIRDGKGNFIFRTTDEDLTTSYISQKNKGTYLYELKIPCELLNPGYYSITLGTGQKNYENPRIQRYEDIIRFKFSDYNSRKSKLNLYRGNFMISPSITWNGIHLDD